MKKRTAVLFALAVLVTASSCGLRPERPMEKVPIESPSAAQVESVGLTREEMFSTPTPAPTASASPSPAPTDAPSMTMETAAPAPLSPTSAPTEAPAITPAPAPTSAPTVPPTPAATPTSTPAHVHEWVAVTETIHHEAVTEQIKVIDQPGTEGHFEGGSYPVVVCRCGEEFTTAESYYAHSEGLGVGHGGFTDSIRSNQVWVEGTPEVSHYETIVVQDAWDEEVITGYRCSCGAVQ